MSAPLPLCVVGGGSIGLRHAAVSRESARVRLTTVVEPDSARRDALAAQGFPVAASIGDAPPDTRAAVIATPTGDHGASGRAALVRGWAVLVEKPVTTTLGEADALCAEADAAGLALVTGHHRRCHPFVAPLRERLGEIGELVAVQGLWCLRKHDSYYDVAWRRGAGAGPIMTNLSHEIDLLRHLAGEIAEVSALTSNTARGLAVEDTAAIALRFENGALGTFLISDAAASPWSFELATGENPEFPKHGEDCLRFIGTRGALSFPSGVLWGASAPGEIEWRKPLARREGVAFAPVDPLLEQIERFARLVDGGEDGDLASGRDGRATLAATLASRLSGQTGRPTAPAQVPADYRGD